MSVKLDMTFLSLDLSVSLSLLMLDNGKKTYGMFIVRMLHQIGTSIFMESVGPFTLFLPLCISLSPFLSLALSLSLSQFMLDTW